jgi:hypothetical protein
MINGGDERFGGVTNSQGFLSILKQYALCYGFSKKFLQLLKLFQLYLKLSFYSAEIPIVCEFVRRA